MLPNEFTPDVTACLTEWDRLTDSVVWLIEQEEDFHLSCGKIVFENLPRHHIYGGFEMMQEQVGRLTGYTKDHHNATFIFNAKRDYIQVQEPESASGIAEAEGIIIEVEKFQEKYPYDSELFATFVIEGDERKTYKIQSKKVAAPKVVVPLEAKH